MSEVDEPNTGLMRSIIQRIATGPELSKDISRAEARAGMRLVLDGAVDPVEAGVFLIALRMKRESDDEMCGLLDAIRDAAQSVVAPVDELIDLGDPYDGYARSLPIAPFLPAQQSSPADSFEKQVRPLLAENCYACHSSSSSPLMGGFQLDREETFRKGGSRGAPIDQANPEASLLLRAVRHSDPQIRMPPTHKMSDEAIATLTNNSRRGTNPPSSNLPDGSTAASSARPPSISRRARKPRSSACAS